MKERQPKNPTASVRPRLLDLSRKSGEPMQILVTRYALGRLLFHLSQSTYKDRFILKGAFLFTLWTGKMHRPTRDLDLLGSGKLDAQALHDIFHKWLSATSGEKLTQRRKEQKT